MTPENVRKLVEEGHQILVEKMQVLDQDIQMMNIQAQVQI